MRGKFSHVVEIFAAFGAAKFSRQKSEIEVSTMSGKIEFAVDVFPAEQSNITAQAVIVMDQNDLFEFVSKLCVVDPLLLSKLNGRHDLASRNVSRKGSDNVRMWDRALT